MDTHELEARRLELQRRRAEESDKMALIQQQIPTTFGMEHRRLKSVSWRIGRDIAVINEELKEVNRQLFGTARQQPRTRDSATWVDFVVRVHRKPGGGFQAQLFRANGRALDLVNKTADDLSWIDVMDGAADFFGDMALDVMMIDEREPQEIT